MVSIRLKSTLTRQSSFLLLRSSNGQFEYLRLPFDYSEAPAEFQKRIVQILQKLIREDKILVYIDDILIPSKSVNENLEVLKEVLLILKKYGFELNYKKMSFSEEKN